MQTFELKCFSEHLTKRPFSRKDTVLVSFRVLRGSWHVEQNKPGIVGFIHDDLVEFDGGVHPPDVGVVSESRQRRR